MSNSILEEVEVPTFVGGELIVLQLLELHLCMLERLLDHITPTGEVEPTTSVSQTLLNTCRSHLERKDFVAIFMELNMRQLGYHLRLARCMTTMFLVLYVILHHEEARS